MVVYGCLMDVVVVVVVVVVVGISYGICRCTCCEDRFAVDCQMEGCGLAKMLWKILQNHFPRPVK